MREHQFIIIDSYKNVLYLSKEESLRVLNIQAKDLENNPVRNKTFKELDKRVHDFIKESTNEKNK